MGKTYEHISPELREWIRGQKIFFVATAPLSEDGHVNCSPKGLDSFRVIGEDVVAYQDLTGSGIETIAHLRENGRIVIMFCAFDGAPKIVRLHGTGKVVTPDDIPFGPISTLFTPHDGTRAYILVEVTRVSDSCGYAVPKYEFRDERDVLDKWTANKGDTGLKEYRQLKNAKSIDGIDALQENSQPKMAGQ